MFFKENRGDIGEPRALRGDYQNVLPSEIFSAEALNK